MASSPPQNLPSSYASLDLQHIRVFHVPESSPTVTPVVVVKLWRPGKNNAFTDTMKNDMVRVYEMFDVDDRVKCIVLTGEGKMFCAGADLEIGFPGGEKGRTKAEKENEHRDRFVQLDYSSALVD